MVALLAKQRPSRTTVRTGRCSSLALRRGSIHMVFLLLGDNRRVIEGSDLSPPKPVVISLFAISRGDYHWQHETCWYAVNRGKADREMVPDQPHSGDQLGPERGWTLHAEAAGTGPIRNHTGDSTPSRSGTTARHNRAPSAMAWRLSRRIAVSLQRLEWRIDSAPMVRDQEHTKRKPGDRSADRRSSRRSGRDPGGLFESMPRMWRAGAVRNMQRRRVFGTSKSRHRRTRDALAQRCATRSGWQRIAWLLESARSKARRTACRPRSRDERRADRCEVDADATP